MVRRGRDQPHARGRQADARDVLVDLVPGELPALAGLRALGHLDLQLVRVREVVDRDSEAARRDLLDRRAPRVPVADGILAALAGVRAAADPVHRDRQRLVRLARQRAERHRAGREPLDDRARRLDLVQGDPAVPGLAEAEQPAQGRTAGILGVHRGRVLLVRLPAAVSHRVLQESDRVRVPLPVLTVAAPRVEPEHGQQRVVCVAVAVRPCVPGERVAGEHVDPDAADPRGRSGEVALHELGRESDGLEDLRAAVGRDRRDPHLGEHLEQALGNRPSRPAGPPRPRSSRPAAGPARPARRASPA